MVSALAVALAGCGGDDDGGVIVDAAVGTPDAPLSERVVFRLAYDSDVDDMIYVQTGTEAGGQGWLRVLDGAGSELRILDDCGQCNCDQCDPCAVCGAGLPVVTAIPRGGSVEWSWDYRVFGGGTCATTGQSCEAASLVAQTSYTARFCWSYTASGVGTGHQVGELVCANEPFTFGPQPPAEQQVLHEECACG